MRKIIIPARVNFEKGNMTFKEWLEKDGRYKTTGVLKNPFNTWFRLRDLQVAYEAGQSDHPSVGMPTSPKIGQSKEELQKVRASHALLRKQCKIEKAKRQFEQRCVQFVRMLAKQVCWGKPCWHCKARRVLKGSK